MEVVENSPAFFSGALPSPGKQGHKYHRGHVLVAGGGLARTGASRLAAIAALRIGAGLVTIASPADAVPVYANHLTAVMLQEAGSADELLSAGNGKGINSVVAGPALGTGTLEHEKVMRLFECPHPLLLDADALTLLADERNFERLVRQRDAAVILTPHEGEFSRLFPEISLSNRISAARQAADQSGAHVVLKGPETVIAAPDGQIIVSRHASPWLATAGSGDVLAGFIGGLTAQGDGLLERICAAVWIHGDAARRFGPGLISEDLPGLVPEVLRSLAK